VVIDLLLQAFRLQKPSTRKKWFCYGNKIWDNKYFFVAATKTSAAATKRFVDRTKHFVVVTTYFCYPYCTNDLVGITKPFIPCKEDVSFQPNANENNLKKTETR